MADINANAHLYGLQLFYRKNAPPYVCLSLPWWVQTPEDVYQQRHVCSIEPLNCGERVFHRISEDLRRAQHSVDIITWGFDPGMVLVRGAAADSGQRYGDLLKEIAGREKHPVQVRLLVWHDDALAQKKVNNMPGYYGKRYPNIGSAENGFHSIAHQNYNAAWFAEVCAGVTNLTFHVRVISVKTLWTSLRGESHPWNTEALASMCYPTHHQKMVLIDYESPETAIGYVMGHNSITDFWDTEHHLFQDPRRERFYHTDPATAQERAWREGPALDAAGVYVPGYSPSAAELEQKEQAVRSYLRRNTYVAKPYQDVSCRLRGPVLYDLNHNFCEAWEKSAPPSPLFVESCWLAARAAEALIPPSVTKAAKDVGERVHKEPPAEFIQRRKTIPCRDFEVAGGQHSVQLLRTQPMYGQKSIKECYANMTRQMHHYMFIQNQYIQYEPWADGLMEDVQNLRDAQYLKPFYVFMLTSTPEKDGMDLATYGIASKVGQSETMVREHNEAVEKARKGDGPMPSTFDQLSRQGINVVMGSLWTCNTKPAGPRLFPDDYEEIYIHAKVAIVDDAAFTLGSANLNLRSMALDSELNIFSQAHDVAYQLRTELFAQCTGEGGPPKFSNMKSTFEHWITVMNRNADLKATGQPLLCPLLPFHVDREPGSPVV